ncbi:50S ribosomal protein L30 [Ferroacidibacillus organovorans]|uniref:Large ribosomal subunit protein uL30 n=1 Tax=Ferroacidibacillus organovorans TaxID=1765683 RepID=A0A117SXE7_9BACL|nr:50S ribosomal protein L30 [Ferroacidibacillus organovorans]
MKSVIGQNKQQKATVQALGLRKIRQSVIREDSPSLRGMIDKVSHLVQYKVIEA